MLFAITVEVGTDNNIARSLDRCVRHGQHITKEVANAATSIFVLAKLRTGSRTRRSRYFR